MSEIKPSHLAKPLVSSLNVVAVFFLAVIALATLVAGAQEIYVMFQKQHVDLADLLLLFIYLEVLAMVSIYMESGSLPIRMPLYIAIVALARHLILDMKTISEWGMIATAAAILVIAVAILVIRFGQTKYPYEYPREKAQQHEHQI